MTKQRTSGRFSPGASAVGFALGFAVALVPVLSRACGWSWETYDAEAKSLPCVYDAVVGYYPKHSPEYHEAVIAAVEYARTWAPDWTAGLDAEGLSQMHLGRFDAAKATMEHRYRVAKDAYASHANLGTLYTFTGDYALSLEHIDLAMKIEPGAHFGREKYHRKLVEFLRDVKADPLVATSRNFLGVTLTTEQRMKGSKEVFAALGVTDDAIDALVSMLAVYGAEDVAEIYLTLGELLAARGFPKLAWTAYTRATELGHPRKAELATFRTQVMAMFRPAPPAARRRASVGDGFDVAEPTSVEHGGRLGIQEFYATRRADAADARKSYADWERQQIGKGLAVWTEDGVHALYAKMNEIRIRCRAPSIIDAVDPLDPFAVPSAPIDRPAPCPMCDWKSRAAMDGQLVRAAPRSADRNAPVPKGAP